MRDPDSQLIEAARQGNPTALTDLLRAIQEDIYGIALRMLWHPEDARDATQEILLKLVTHLATFRGDSRFSTWVFRIAVNHLQDFRKGRLETTTLDFDAFAADLADGLEATDADWERNPEHQVLLEEIKVGCTLGMLACLDRGHRLAYILGEILELNEREAAEALSLPPATFRKRLSRARRTINEFMFANCGIVNPGNPCRCSRRASRAVALGRVNPMRPLFSRASGDSAAYSTAVAEVRSLEATRRAAALMRSSGAPLPDVAGELVALVLQRHR